MSNDLLSRLPMKAIVAVIDSKGESFSQLSKLAGLDPAQDFVGANLSQIDFGDDDLSGFNFSRANLTGAILARAQGLDAVKIDHFTKISAENSTLIQSYANEKQKYSKTSTTSDHYELDEIDPIKSINTWAFLCSAFERQTEVVGMITARRRGGYDVDLGGASGYAPLSVFGDKEVPIKEIIGRRAAFLIQSLNQERREAFLSRSPLVQEQQFRFLNTLSEGDNVTGRVTRIQNNAVFLDISGVQAMLRSKDLSWTPVKHPSEILKVGDKIQVKVLSYDRSKKRVLVGLKQTSNDPWDNAQALHRGKICHARLVHILDYGALFEIEPGLEGLVHKSSLPPGLGLAVFRARYTVGYYYGVKVDSIDLKTRRLRLILADTDSANHRLFHDTVRWNQFDENNPPGTVLHGTITRVVARSLIVGLPGHYTGTIPETEIAWSGPEGKNLRRTLRPGRKIKVKVLSVDPARRNIVLALDRSEVDPRVRAIEDLKQGMTVSCSITRITKTGASILIRETFSGFVSADLLGKDFRHLTVGAAVPLRILSVNPDTFEIRVSWDNGTSAMFHEQLKADTTAPSDNSKERSKRPK